MLWVGCFIIYSQCSILTLVFEQMRVVFFALFIISHYLSGQLQLTHNILLIYFIFYKTMVLCFFWYWLVHFDGMCHYCKTNLLLCWWYFELHFVLCLLVKCACLFLAEVSSVWLSVLFMFIQKTLSVHVYYLSCDLFI